MFSSPPFEKAGHGQPGFFDSSFPALISNLVLIEILEILDILS